MRGGGLSQRRPIGVAPPSQPGGAAIAWSRWGTRAFPAGSTAAQSWCAQSAVACCRLPLRHRGAPAANTALQNEPRKALPGKTRLNIARNSGAERYGERGARASHGMAGGCRELARSCGGLWGRAELARSCGGRRGCAEWVRFVTLLPQSCAQAVRSSRLPSPARSGTCGLLLCSAWTARRLRGRAARLVVRHGGSVARWLCRPGVHTGQQRRQPQAPGA